mgnify:CR=1 FL=1
MTAKLAALAANKRKTTRSVRKNKSRNTFLDGNSLAKYSSTPNLYRLEPMSSFGTTNSNWNSAKNLTDKKWTFTSNVNVRLSIKAAHGKIAVNKKEL